jgi:hypothetical protein
MFKKQVALIFASLFGVLLLAMSFVGCHWQPEYPRDQHEGVSLPIERRQAKKHLVVEEITTSLSFQSSLAYHYAPIHYQDTDRDKAEADYITAWDYDGDVVSTNNWDNLDAYPLNAVVYFSVVESHTHWFIVYMFFHPRDWRDGSTGEEHENDTESLLAIVRKDGSTFGKLLGIVTVFHFKYCSFTPDNSHLTGIKNFGGVLRFGRNEDGTNCHPLTGQEAKKHGLKAWPYVGNFVNKPNDDGIIYYPSLESSEVPLSGNDRKVMYKLIPLWELWERQLTELELDHPSACITFYAWGWSIGSVGGVWGVWGILKGDESGGCGKGWLKTCKPHAAKAPWGSGGTGIMALDPIRMAHEYFTGWTTSFSWNYVKNRYLENLRDRNYSSANLPRGWSNELDLDALLARLRNP